MIDPLLAIDNGGDKGLAEGIGEDVIGDPKNARVGADPADAAEWEQRTTETRIMGRQNRRDAGEMRRAQPDVFIRLENHGRPLGKGGTRERDLKFQYLVERERDGAGRDTVHKTGTMTEVRRKQRTANNRRLWYAV
jgi:hypothetical protein